MAKIKKVTKQRALKELYKVVEEAGRDYVYPRNKAGGCSYAPSPSSDLLKDAERCAIGRVLTNLGVSDEQLENLSGYIGLSWDRLPFSVDPDAREILKAFQHEQDNGVSWGKCLDQVEQM